MTLAPRLAVATAAGGAEWSVRELELFSRSSAQGTVTVASRTPATTCGRASGSSISTSCRHVP